jgi:PQQ-like domain
LTATKGVTSVLIMFGGVQREPGQAAPRGAAILTATIVCTLISTSAVAADISAAPGTATPGGGTQLWDARYDGPTQKEDRPSSVVTSPDGSKVFVTGFSDRTGSFEDVATLAYDPSTGTQLWLTRYDGPNHGDDGANDAVVSPDGSKLYLTGWSSASNGLTDYLTQAYDTSTGAVLWTSTYDGLGHSSDSAASVALSPDGTTVFVTGFVDDGGFNWDVGTVAYEASSGTQRWVDRYDGSGHSYDQGADIAVSVDGTKVFVTGYVTVASGQSALATVAYTADTGGVKWARQVLAPGTDFDVGNAVVPSPDGSKVFVAGSGLAEGGGPYDALAVAFDTASGRVVWRRRYDDPGHGIDLFSSVQVAPDGSTVFASGDSAGARGDQDWLTVAYDATTGSTRWTEQYAGASGSDDSAGAMTMAPDGTTLYVTGYAGDPTAPDGDITTVAYLASTGNTQWLAIYTRGGSGGVSIAVAPDGSKVFVTGEIKLEGTQFHDRDYLTVAYQA